VAQVAVSLLLLVGAGLVTRSLEAARATDPGFDPDHVSTLSIDLRQNGYDEVRGRAFYRTLLDELCADSGTELATLALHEPLNLLETPAQRVSIDGYEPRRGEDLAFQSNTVGPDYFSTLRIPLVAGREFETSDDEQAAPVAIVNHTLATRFWGTAGKALGRRIRIAEGDWRTVVGVAADIKYLRINESPRPYVYLPFLQAYRTDMIVHTRGPAPADVLVDRARLRIAALDPDLPLMNAGALADRTEGALIFFTFAATMLFVFGTAGMALAALGTYGLVSYTIRASTREIGIRMALGATSVAVVRGLAVRGMRLGVLGIAVGLLVALAGTRLLGSVLYGVSATDVTAYAWALGIVLATVSAATVVPAWRASQTNPLSALRHQ
jgi:predicted permease